MPGAEPYKRGRKKEYKIMAQEKRKGNIVIRSAGSHSPIDLVSIDTENNKITFIQSKSNLMSAKEKDNIEMGNFMFNGIYECTFEVR
jgi:hypothetical protein